MITVAKEMDGLNKKFARWKKVSGEKCKDIVSEAAEFAIRAAAKHTAPAAGKTGIPAKSYKRDIKVLGGGTNGRKKRWAVLYKTAKKSGIKYFSKLKDAKDFSKIKRRGLARAFWFLNLLGLGKNLSADQQTILNKSPEIANKAPHRISISNGICGRSITVVNSADNVSKHSSNSVAEGLRSAKNRVGWLLKDLEKRMK